MKRFFLALKGVSAYIPTVEMFLKVSGASLMFIKSFIKHG
jgi:hypothetical protein